MRIAEPEMLYAIARVYAEEILAGNAFIDNFEVDRSSRTIRGLTRVRFTDGTYFAFAEETDVFYSNVAGEHVAEFFRSHMPSEVELGALFLGRGSPSADPFGREPVSRLGVPSQALARSVEAINALATNSPSRKAVDQEPLRKLPPSEKEAQDIRDAVVQTYRNSNLVLRHISRYDVWAVVMPGNGEIQAGSGAYRILSAVMQASTIALRMQEEDDEKVRAAAASRKRRRRMMS